MNILLQTKEEIEAHFGKSATMAPNLLGMVGQGEEAFGFLTGDMSEGFEITVGFFNGKARVIAIVIFMAIPGITRGLSLSIASKPTRATFSTGTCTRLFRRSLRCSCRFATSANSV